MVRAPDTRDRCGYRPGRSSSFPVVRRLARSSCAAGCIGQRVGAADPHPEFALGDPVEYLARAPPQFRDVGDVVDQGGTGEEQRPAAVQPLRVDGRHLAARGSVEHHHAARAQRRQAVVERVLAHAVVHDMRACAFGYIVDDGPEKIGRSRRRDRRRRRARVRIDFFVPQSQKHNPPSFLLF